MRLFVSIHLAVKQGYLMLLDPFSMGLHEEKTRGYVINLPNISSLGY